MDDLVDAAIILLVGVPVALIAYFSFALARQARRARRLPRTSFGQPRSEERREEQ